MASFLHVISVELHVLKMFWILKVKTFCVQRSSKEVALGVYLYTTNSFRHYIENKIGRSTGSLHTLVFLTELVLLV